MGFVALIDMIYIPIIVALLFVLAIIYLVLSTISLFKKLYREEYHLDSYNLKSNDFSINLKEINSLKVHSSFGSIKRIKIESDEGLYLVRLLENGGLYSIIKRILEIKNE